jgi:hypothetical protein
MVMKTISLLVFIVFTTGANGKEIYTGSTPANAIVKSFLGIPLSDSVDFIRWKLVTGGDRYSIHCDYGIGKPNTKRFIDPRSIDASGPLTKENN